jgi:class 3 adenylate cyclase
MSSVLAAHKHPGFNVHVGVHTGAVLLAGGVDADGSIRGIAVNIAARMERTAPAGALRISHDTYAQVRGLFDAQERQRASIDTFANALGITRPTVGQVSSARTSNP